MALNVGKIEATVGLDTTGWQKSVNKTQQEADKLSNTLKNKLHGSVQVDNNSALSKIKQTDGGIQSLSGSFLTLKNSAIVAGIAMAAAITYKTISKVVELTAELQKLSIQYRYIAGDAEKASMQFAFVRDISSKLGLDIDSVAKSFAKFSAASKSSGLDIVDVQNLFIGLSEAVTTLGLSGPEASLAFKAVEQIASKGTVAMEELRGQLGEQLPGAFGLSAKAMGMTTAALNEFIGKGSLASTEFLPKFAKTLHDEFGKAAIDASNNVSAMTNRIKNSIFDLKITLTTLFKTPIVEPLINNIQSAFNKIVNFTKQIAPEISSILKTVSPLFGILSTLFSYLSDVVLSTVALITKSIRQITSVISNMVLAVKKSFANVISYFVAGAQNLSSIISEKFNIGNDISASLYDINNKVQKWANETEKIEYEPIKWNLDPLKLDDVFTKASEGVSKFIEKTAKNIENNDKINKAIEKEFKFLDDISAIELANLSQKNALNDYIKEQFKFLDDQDVFERLDYFDKKVSKTIEGFFADIDLNEILVRENKKLNLVIDSWFASIDQMAKELREKIPLALELGTKSIEDFGDALSEFTTTGKFSFKEFINSLLADLTKLIIKLTITEPLIESLKNSLNNLGSSSGGSSIFSSILSGASAFFGSGGGSSNTSQPQWAAQQQATGSVDYVFGDGGTIKEPVFGIGKRTGSSYLIGEKGYETVIPNSQLKAPTKPKMDIQSGNSIIDNSTQNKNQTVQNVSLNINAVDANSFVSLAQKNPQAIIGPVLSALRIGDKALVRGIQTAVGGM